MDGTAPAAARGRFLHNFAQSRHAEPITIAVSWSPSGSGSKALLLTGPESPRWPAGGPFPIARALSRTGPSRLTTNLDRSNCTLALTGLCQPPSCGQRKATRTKPLIELRKGQRIRSYVAGTIAFNDLKSTLSCLVRSMSARGVGLEFEQAALLPYRFDFVLPSKSVSFRARLRWRTAGAAGIEFLSRPQSVGAVPLDMSIRLRSLERERAMLRRRLSTLTGSVR